MQTPFKFYTCVNVWQTLIASVKLCGGHQWFFFILLLGLHWKDRKAYNNKANMSKNKQRGARHLWAVHCSINDVSLASNLMFELMFIPMSLMNSKNNRALRYPRGDWNVVRGGSLDNHWLRAVSEEVLDPDEVFASYSVSVELCEELPMRHIVKGPAEVHHRRKTKKTPKLRVTGLCEGNSPVTGDFPAQGASNTENVSIWLHHHGKISLITTHTALDQSIPRKIIKVDHLVTVVISVQ